MYKPTHIRRVAKAEADAAIIRSKAEAKATDIAERAKERILNRERRRQQNIESIVEKAIEYTPEHTDEREPDEDWLVSFFEQCQDVKNEEMQTLWAKLLAGEVARPGSYSLRTLALVKVLRREEAHLFTQFCTFVWTIAGQLSPVIFVEPSGNFMTLSFDDLNNLATLGLINFSVVGAFAISLTGTETPVRTLAVYNGHPRILEIKTSERAVQVGNAMLTTIGKELAPIAGSVPNEDYCAKIIEKWRTIGIEAKELPERASASTTPEKA